MSIDVNDPELQRLGALVDLCRSKGMPCEVAQILPGGGLHVGKAPTVITVVQNSASAEKEPTLYDQIFGDEDQ
jgi:hypothetical protein